MELSLLQLITVAAPATIISFVLLMQFIPGMEL